MTRRVVVTGIGLVSPLGVGTEATWQAALQGRAGVAPITLFDASAHSTRFAAEVKGFDPLQWIERKELKKCARFIQFAIAAAHMAVDQSGLVIDEATRDRVGVSIGSGIGGFEVIEREHRTLLERGPDRVSPFFILSAIVNLAAGQVSMRFGARGPNTAVATACTTGAHAVGDAYRLIQHGQADAMICGGAEAAISPLGIAGFAAMRALSQRNDDPARASRPWDADRDGFVVGEGAGVLVLEEAEAAARRGATVLAELVGYGMSGDAHHVTAPPPDGNGVARAMRAALDDAGLRPEAIGYVNAHATSTPLGDRAEAMAIAGVFGGHAASLAVSSTKSMTGHLLGGAGALEAGLTVLALRDQVAPPTINLDRCDLEVPLDLVPHVAQPRPMTCAITNSFGFGGTNASLIFARA
ncbi:3-oxoacyl-[acyl-carrier-protein] synthase 2 [Luteitalea sp. TBR-22]|uniref:beta-ketoacyl-ACP synthase II n=1 Tax=Luteitalea sp. TBR-22 TaxID=2802971 RepID=UPI001AF1A4A4|nr:beta-ketoacyl-ACP synthase II [Luteitalea sp. TBR-22]BCS33836.1 3-oxoacyl-[acyl-carrier-protein] synthase 2 [Luteitalea sp. TBR-22]